MTVQQEDSMSDPAEKTQANPHPVSQHRTPREIAADEGGPIGKADADVVAKEASEANEEAKTQAKRPPPDVISKSQRKRL
jgi:hypothetical protein